MSNNQHCSEKQLRLVSGVGLVRAGWRRSRPAQLLSSQDSEGRSGLEDVCVFTHFGEIRSDEQQQGRASKMAAAWPTSTYRLMLGPDAHMLESGCLSWTLFTWLRCQQERHIASVQSPHNHRNPPKANVNVDSRLSAFAVKCLPGKPDPPKP